MSTKLKAPRHRQPTADEQHVLEHLTVRPLAPHEAQRFDQLLVQHHYLHRSERVRRTPPLRRYLSRPMAGAGRLALIAQATFSGVRRGPQDLADYAATLAQGQLRALGFRCDKPTGRVRCPGVTPSRDVLLGVAAAALEGALLAWQAQLLGAAQDPLVIVDGKTLRHAHLELVSAVNGQGRWLSTVPVAEGSNEISAARQLLTQVFVQNKTTLADALHTQLETAQPILFAGGDYYALTVKANQKQQVQTLATLLTPGKFSPLAHAADPRTDPGTQLQSPGDSSPGMPGSDPGTSRFSRRPPDCAPVTAGAACRSQDDRNGASDQPPDPGATRRLGLAAPQAERLGDRKPVAPRAGRVAE